MRGQLPPRCGPSHGVGCVLRVFHAFAVWLMFCADRSFLICFCKFIGGWHEGLNSSLVFGIEGDGMDSVKGLGAVLRFVFVGGHCSCNVCQVGSSVE